MKRPKPDNRLNWRDENMPVLRMAKARLPNGKYEEKFTLQPITPEQSQEYHAWKMNNGLPNWKDDPTYFLKKLK